MFATLLFVVSLYHATSADTAKVVRVIDGDTIVAQVGDKDPVRVRLVGVDAPELAEKCGGEAKHLLAEMLPVDEPIFLIAEGSDRYGRTLGHVWTVTSSAYSGGPRYVNFRMVRSGLARAERRWRFPWLRPFIDAENLASQEKTGVWGDRCAPVAK